MRVGSFPYRLGLVIASLAIWILLIVLGHSHDPKIANLGGMPDEKHRKARAVASDISSSLQPPEIPDRGAVGFRSKVQRQIELVGYTRKGHHFGRPLGTTWAVAA